VCGLSYTTVDSDPIKRADTGAEVGRVWLMRNAVTGYTCVATIKSAWVGSLTRTAANTYTAAFGTVNDDGPELHYAGPVRGVAGKGACVLWGGSMIDPVTGTVYYHSRVNPAIGYNSTCF